MMRALKENSIAKTAWDRMSDEEKAANAHKIVRGVFQNIERPEYTAAYNRLISVVQGGGR